MAIHWSLIRTRPHNSLPFWWNRSLEILHSLHFEGYPPFGLPPAPFTRNATICICKLKLGVLKVLGHMVGLRGGRSGLGEIDGACLPQFQPHCHLSRHVNQRMFVTYKVKCRAKRQFFQLIMLDNWIDFEEGCLWILNKASGQELYPYTSLLIHQHSRVGKVAFPFPLSMHVLSLPSGSCVAFSSLQSTPFFCHLLSNSLITLNFLRLLRDQAAHLSWSAYIKGGGI